MKTPDVGKIIRVVLAALAVLVTAMVGRGHALSVTSPINGIDTWDATPNLTWYWNGPEAAAQFIVQVDERSDFLYPLEFEVNLYFTAAGDYGLAVPAGGFGTTGTHSFSLPDTLALTCVPEGEITRYYWQVIANEDTKSNLGWFDIVPPSLHYPLNGFDVYSATPDLVFGANENIAGDTDVVDTWAIWIDKNPGFADRIEFNPDGSPEVWPKKVNTPDSQAILGLDPTQGYYAIDTASFNLKNGTYYWRVMAYDAGTPYTNWSATRSFTIRPVDLRSLPDNITTNSPQPTFCWDPRPGIPYESVLDGITGGVGNTGGSEAGDSYIFQFAWFNNDNFEDQNDGEGWGVDTGTWDSTNLLIQARIPGTRTCFTIGDTYPTLVYDVLSPDVSSTLNDGRLPEGTYWWRIMSVNDDSWADSTNWSVKWKVVIDLEDCVPPEVPIVQSPGACTTTGTNGGDRINTGAPTFTWTEVADPSGSQPSDLWYEVQLDHDGSFSIADSEDVEYDLWIRNGNVNAAAPSEVSSFNFSNGQDANGNQVAWLSDRTTAWTGATLPDGIWFWRVRALDPTCNEVVGNWSEVCYFTVDTTAPVARLIYPGADSEFCSQQFHINDCTPILKWIDLPPYGASSNGLDEPPAVTYQVRIVNRNLGVYDSANVVNLPNSDANGWVAVGGGGTAHSFITTVCLEDSDTDGDFYWWELQVTDDAGNTWSDSFAFIVDTKAPTTPQDLSDTLDDGDYEPDPTPIFIWNEGDTLSQTAWVDWSATAATYLTSTEDGNPPETVAWVISHGEELRYDLQIAPTETGWVLLVVDVTELSQPTYTAALPDGSYIWRVRARDCAGNYSPWKAQVFVIDTIPPCTPELLFPSHGIALADTTPLFDWADVTDPNIISYNIQIDTESSFTAPLVIDQWNTGTPPVSSYQTANAEAMDNRVIYYWRVTAYDKAGNQCASQVWSFNPEMGEPSDPTLLAPFGCVSYQDEGYAVEPDISPSVFSGTGGALSRPFSRTRPTFYWEDTDTQQRTLSYIFELVKAKDAGDPDFIDPDVSVSGLTGSEYTLPPAYELKEGHYYWRVMAVDEAGNRSNGGNMMAFTVDLTPPDMPNYSSPDDAIIFNDDTPTLDWDEPEAYDLRYQLQIDDDADFSSPILDINDFESQLVGGDNPLDGSTTGYIHGSQMTVTPVLPEGTYYWRVRAMDCAGNISEWSHTSPYRRFTIDTTAPDAPNLISPADWHTTNDITPTMTWERVVDSKTYHSSELSGNFINSDYCDTVYYLIQIEVDDNLNNGDNSGDVFNQTVDYSNDPRDPHDVYHPEMFQVLDGRMTFTPTILPSIGAGRTFYWRVTAIDCAENESTWSEIRAIRIDPHVDSCPSLVSPDDGTYTNDDTPFFDWSDEGSAYEDEGTGPSIDKITYNIQVDNNIDFSSPEVNEWTKVSSYVPTVALRDGTYYWRVGGVDEAGNRCGQTGWSADVWEIHIDTDINNCYVSCSSVRLVTPADGQCVNDTTPIFDWDPMGDPSAPIVYTLQVSDNIEFSDPLEINISELPFEPLLEFRTNGVPSLQNIANTRWPIDQDGDGRFNITEADYQAYNGQFGGRFDGALAGLNAFPEGVYYWRVKAFDRATNSTKWSTPNRFEVDLQSPARPTLIYPARVSQVVNDQAPTPVTDSTPTFEWTTVSDATHYLFQMDRDSDFSSPEVNVEVEGQGSSTVKYALPYEQAMIMGEIYYWRVAAVDCGGNRSEFTSAWSVRKSATYVNRLMDDQPPYDDRIYVDDVVWDISGSPYIIEDLVKVWPGVSLTIEPGVEVLFRPFSTLTNPNQPPELIVQGTLKAAGRAPSAEGTIPERRVTFSTWTQPDGQVYHPKAGDWTRIKFEETAQDSIISYADISYGGWYDDSLGEYHRGNIEVYGTDVVIDHIRSTNSAAAGILYSGPRTADMTNDPTLPMNPTLTNSEFSDNRLDGANFKIDDGTITIDNCELARNGRWGILNEGNYYVGNHTDLVVTDCNIHDNGLRPTDEDGAGGGIYSTATASETITDNLIQDNDGWAVIKGQHRLGDCVGGYIIKDNLIKGNNHNAVWIDAANHCTDTVWYANYTVAGTSWNYNDLAPYFVQRVIVEEGVTLTVNPGVVVKFDETKPKSEGAGLEVRGRLIADADPEGSLHAFYIIDPPKSVQPDDWTANYLVFTSCFDDEFGGDINCDGASHGRTADNGDWQGILFWDSSLDDSIINRAIILYSKDGIELHNASPTITNNKIAYNAYRAVAVREDSDPLIEWNHLTYNDSYSPDDDYTYTDDLTGYIAGTIATFCGEEAEPIIRNNLINHNRNYAIGITANKAYLITDNEIFGNQYNAIKICGDITGKEEVIWEEDGAPFYLADGLKVGEDSTWRISPGVILKSAGALTINGRLKANGTADRLITFTSFKDDEFGGDSNGDSEATTPRAGDWSGLHFVELEIKQSLLVDLPIQESFTVRGLKSEGECCEGKEETYHLYREMSVITDASWKRLEGEAAPSDWMQVDFDDSGWKTAAVDRGDQPRDPKDWLPETEAHWLKPAIEAGGERYYRQEIFIDPPPLRNSEDKLISRQITAPLHISAVTDYEVYVNGQLIAKNEDSLITFNPGETYQLGSYLREGKNVVAVQVTSPPEDLELSYCRIRYAAAGVTATLRDPIIRDCHILENTIGIEGIKGASIQIDRARITNNRIGLLFRDFPRSYPGAREKILRLKGCEITDNLEFGLLNQDESYTIEAESNYWGAGTGPKDDSTVRPLYNPAGTGDRVSDFVDYAPWAKDLHSPIAEAGPDITTGVKTLVILDAGASYDPEGEQLSYFWTQAAGPERIILENVVQPKFTPQEPGEYIFQLVVANAAGYFSAPSTVKVKALVSSQVELRWDQPTYTKVSREEFEVEVEVGDRQHPVSDLFGLVFEISAFPSEAVEVLEVSPGPFLDIDPGKLVFFESEKGQGRIEIGLSRKKGLHSKGVSGFEPGQSIAKVIFRIAEGLASGTRITLVFSNIIARDSLDRSISLLPTSSEIIIKEGSVSQVLVWPGDTNNDRLVDARDVLPIGLYWKTQGPPRETASSNWTPQPAASWKVTLAAYADANGDGIVDARDILPIGMNWHKTQQTKAGSQMSEIRGQQSEVSIQPLDLEPLRAMYEVLKDTPYTELTEVLAEYIQLALANQVPARSQLLQNYPNPFNPEVWIPFRLAEEAETTIFIYNLAGQLVKAINAGKLPPGSYLSRDRAAYWDGRDESGEEVSSGIYFYQLQAGSFTGARKMIVLK
ncbi:MAG: right-handed parallel beta-helix repeat-containing protein [bacterium]